MLRRRISQQIESDVILVLIALISAFASFTRVVAQTQPKETTPETVRPLVISHLTGNFYVYTTYRILNGSPFPSNSMYLVTENGIVMFDTPWDTTQFQSLLDTLETRYHKQVLLCISTHFHDDRTAGLDFLKSKGIPTYSSKLTYDLCKERGEKQAEYFFLHDTTLKLDMYLFKHSMVGQAIRMTILSCGFRKRKYSMADVL